MNRFAARPWLNLVIVCTLSLCTSVSTFSQQAPPNPPLPPPNPNGPSSELPENPSATGVAQQPPPATAPSAGETQAPSGTAAAPSVPVTGNAVSRPAGAAVAPPKQRQIRSFLIKTGLIVGIGAAVGTVAALSLSSPARVPGSH